jgi:hypothetical protein
VARRSRRASSAHASDARRADIPELGGRHRAAALTPAGAAGP